MSGLREDLMQAILNRDLSADFFDNDKLADSILSIPAMQEIIKKAEIVDSFIGDAHAREFSILMEKAKKWDRLMSITEPLAITPLFEDWHDTWSTTCPCLPLVIGNVIIHIGEECSFRGKEAGKHE